MAERSVHQKAFSRPDSFLPVASVYRMFNTTGMSKGHEAHAHPDTVEVCFVLHGCLDWWLGDSIFSLQSGDIFLAALNEPHGSVDSTLQPCEYYAVHLDPQAFSDEFTEILLRPGLGGHYAAQPEAGDLIQQIFREHEQPDPLSADVVRALCIQLVALLARRRQAHRNRRSSSFVKSVQEQLMKAPVDSNTVALVAKSLGVSTVWLNRKFRDELGVSPAEWMRSRRIAEAKRLLAVERVGVTEAAVRLGYRSSQYFATAFRRETGITPSDYRQRKGLGEHPKIAVAPI